MRVAVSVLAGLARHAVGAMVYLVLTAQQHIVQHIEWGGSCCDYKGAARLLSAAHAR
jgi:Xaa-Pro aminopeptidase